MISRNFCLLAHILVWNVENIFMDSRNFLTKTENTSFSGVPRYLKERCFCKSFQFWSLCPFDVCVTRIIIFNYALQSFKAYCAIWVRRSNFRHQASPRVSPPESTQRQKVELWAKNVR